ncbi:1-hydroxycarotenoid 3,4-desaturase CrtD [Ascidiaceihabitans sp.]|uniref:1-hydroxycarotenoid 3,4-desaturase CrtD n=1 Tax=Ascidiaceihabitans sp. TaxID=1872644 RepID=UPI00329982E3
MPKPSHMLAPHAVVIGAGIAGLATALRLRAQGLDVTVVERHSWVGGKMRTVASDAGPIDAGPTVLTMRHVFDDLFQSAGTRLEDHVTLIPQPTLARHFWPDGSTLDLHSDPDKSSAAVHAFAGTEAAQQFEAFCAKAKRLYAAFDAPMMRSPKPTLANLTKHVLKHPSLIRDMAPLSSLAKSLARDFDDPRLAQLFARYATYVGGLPQMSPAILSLIWQAEAAGVWVVQGGMHKLAKAIAACFTSMGGTLRINCHTHSIETDNGSVTGIKLQSGERLSCDCAVFAGDPRALATGQLGPDVAHIAPQTKRLKRSLSARVHSFAATPRGPDLAHHNVFFDGDPKAEFQSLAQGRVPEHRTLYICAMDRGKGAAPPPLERFEIISNAPATHADTDPQELETWHQSTLQTMAGFGLTFSPTPHTNSITTPQMFDAMFPASLGALYGQTPHGMLAAFQRPTTQTPVNGLYLAGGGTHPGAGVPMATLSAQHAAEAIWNDLTSTSTSARTATPGGMSTA